MNFSTAFMEYEEKTFFFSLQRCKKGRMYDGKMSNLYIIYFNPSHTPSNFLFNIKTTKQQQQTNYGQRKLGIIH